MILEDSPSVIIGLLAGFAMIIFFILRIKAVQDLIQSFLTKRGGKSENDIEYE